MQRYTYNVTTCQKHAWIATIRCKAKKVVTQSVYETRLKYFLGNDTTYMFIMYVYTVLPVQKFAHLVL